MAKNSYVMFFRRYMTTWRLFVQICISLEVSMTKRQDILRPKRLLLVNLSSDYAMVIRLVPLCFSICIYLYPWMSYVFLYPCILGTIFQTEERGWFNMALASFPCFFKFLDKKKKLNFGLSYLKHVIFHCEIYCSLSAVSY